MGDEDVLGLGLAESDEGSADAVSDGGAVWGGEFSGYAATWDEAEVEEAGALGAAAGGGEGNYGC